MTTNAELKADCGDDCWFCDMALDDHVTGCECDHCKAVRSGPKDPYWATEGSAT